jgi:hypothetical protein
VRKSERRMELELKYLLPRNTIVFKIFIFNTFLWYHLVFLK